VLVNKNGKEKWGEVGGEGEVIKKDGEEDGGVHSRSMKSAKEERETGGEENRSGDGDGQESKVQGGGQRMR